MGRHYPRRGHSRGRAYNPGSEAARRHIEEAKRFSNELGGIDDDVKSYFFRLTPAQLRPILDEYGQIHGLSARDYAEKTIAKWSSGRTHMSGMVAERLFNLLPPRMPLSEKYDLVKNLWDHVCLKTTHAFLVGPDGDRTVLETRVRNYLVGVVTGHTIPEAMEKRFVWLSSGDVKVKQQLLNHLRAMERNLVLDTIRDELPVFLTQIHNNGKITGRVTRTLRIGKHECVVAFDPRASGITEAIHVPVPPKTRFAIPSWLWWLVGGVILVFLMTKR
jgi:hypothetical protein